MNVTKMLGYAMVGGLLVLAVPAERAQAVSLIGPGAAAAVVQDGPNAITTEVRWHHHGWRRHHQWHRWHHRRHWRRW